MKYIPKAISAQVARKALVTQKRAPTILFVGGVAGVVTATVLACRATLKLDEVLGEAEEKINTANELRHSNNPAYSEKDYQQDITYIHIRNTVAIVRLYAPAVVLGLVSIGALTKSHNILSQRNAALTAAYVALEQGFNEYRERVAREIGPEKERELRYAVETVDVVNEETGKKEKRKIANPAGASMYAKFFDELNPLWKKDPEYNLMFLKSQQNYANNILQSRGHIFLNEVYDMLGIDHTGAGAVVGWVISKDGDNYVDFGVFSRDSERSRMFVNGQERSILLDFNVDGVIYDKI